MAAVWRVCRTGLLINAAVAAGYFGAKTWDEITRRLIYRACESACGPDVFGLSQRLRR